MVTGLTRLDWLTLGALVGFLASVVCVACMLAVGEDPPEHPT